MIRSLRHLGRTPFFVEDKRSGAWRVSYPEPTLLMDISGSTLLQSLSSLPTPPGNPFSLVTPSSGVETLLRSQLENEVLDRSSLRDGGCLWSSSGSDAMEIAIWVADVYANQSLGCPIKTFLVRRGGYHGNTYLTRFLSTRGSIEHSLRMDGRALIILEEEFAQPGSNPVLDALQKAEVEGWISSPAALVMEPLPTTGRNFLLGESTYHSIIQWCRERKILIILDEIASGTYRHGRFNAFAQYKERAELPDISIISKGLTCGTFPLSCVVLSPQLTKVLENTHARPISFTYGLTDPAAWFALACLRRFDEVLASSQYVKRSTLVGELARRAWFKLKSIKVESSETTIRLSAPIHLAQGILSSMKSAHLWAYCGYSDFPPVDEPDQRAFIHLCPPFDLSVDLTEEMLVKALDIATTADV